MRDGLAEITGQLGDFARTGAWPTYSRPAPEEPDIEWAADATATGDPARDLDRLLDRFRDDIRDAARDHGVTEDQLAEARRHLATAATHIDSLLRDPADEAKGKSPGRPDAGHRPARAEPGRAMTEIGR